MPQVEQVNPQAVTMEEQPQADPGQIEQVVTGIQDGMMLLRDALEKSPGILPEDKSTLDQIIAQYQGFVTNNLGAAPGQPPSPEEAAPTQAPIQAGAAQVAPAQ